MKKNYFLLPSIFIVLFSAFSFGLDMQELVTIQEDMEKKVQRVLDYYLGAEKAIINVKIELRERKIKNTYVEKTEDELKNIPLEVVEVIEEEEDDLPGYDVFMSAKDKAMAKETIYDTQKTSSRERIETLIKEKINRVFVNLVIDESIAPEKVKIAEDLAVKLLKLNKRRDVVNVISLKIQPEIPVKELIPFKGKVKEKVASEQAVMMYIRYGFIFVAAIILVILSFIFLIVITMIRNKNQPASQPIEIKEDRTIRDERKERKSNDDGDVIEFKKMEEKSALQYQNPGEKVADDRLFSFVDESNINKFAHLLEKESVDKKIAAMNFLKPELAAKLLSLLNPEARKEVVLNLSKELLHTPKEIKDFEKQMRLNIDFLAGGKNFTLNMFDFLTAEMSEELLDEVRKTDTAFAADIEKSLYAFEDIVNLDSRFVKHIVKQLGEKEFSFALSGYDEEFSEKILMHLSDGMSEMVRQAIGLFKNQPKSRVLDARHKVVQILKKLNHEGMIPDKGMLIQLAKDRELESAVSAESAELDTSKEEPVDPESEDVPK
jgi:flagellar motor switch protein FliG